MKLSTTAFIYENELNEQHWVCAKCATAKPELNPFPELFEFNTETDLFISMCDLCEDRIIEVEGLNI